MASHFHDVPEAVWLKQHSADPEFSHEAEDMFGKGLDELTALFERDRIKGLTSYFRCR